MPKKVKSRALRKKFKLSWLLILPFLIVLYFAFSFNEGFREGNRQISGAINLGVPMTAKKSKVTSKPGQSGEKTAVSQEDHDDDARDKQAQQLQNRIAAAAAAEAKRIQEAAEREAKRIQDELDRIAREAEQRRIASLSAVKKGR